jgi:nitrate/nitrite transport system permease protein
MCKMKENALKIVLPLLTLIAIIGVWSIVGMRVEGFPSPIATFQASFDVFADPFKTAASGGTPGIAIQLSYSLARVFGGFLIAAAVGIPVGLALGMSKKFYYAVDPYIQIFKPVSPLAWLPLVLFAFKDITTTAIFVIFITSVWPIIINTALGVKSVNEDYINVAKVFRFNSLEMITKIILPVAVPYIFTGMRLSLGTGWLVIVAAEMLTGGIGIGFWIWDEYNNLKYTSIIIGIIIVGVVGLLLDALMGFIANRFDYRNKGGK